MSTAQQALWFVSFAIFVFFVLYTISTFALIALSLFETELMKIERGEYFTPPPRLRRPGISLIAAAYNMEPLIVVSARSLLAVDYEPLEVVIVDDGSTDGTTAALIEAFDLVELPVGDRMAVPTAPITQSYVSRRDARLRVVTKENGGRSDAINAGLNVAGAELVAFVDADTLLEADALQRIAEVFAGDPDNVVAVGGTIRIANGAVVEGHAVETPRLATSGIEASQTAEYLRSFFAGRVAWSRLNGLLIISGAFGVFRRDVVCAAGGLSRQTLGEDMELVMRLHHRLRPRLPRTRIAYAPDANAWTEIPVGFAPLRGQRIRWHVGLLDNLRIHRRMIGRRRFGAVGMLALPYTVLFEVCGPLLQVTGYGVLIALLITDQTSWWYAAAFALVTVLAGFMQTPGAVLIEDVGYHRYRNRDLIVLAGWSLLEVLWYRPLTAVWRTWATVLFAAGRRPGWGSIPRGAAFHGTPGQEPVPAPLPR
jgi:cellulose synthase/poly-beta-1,6-N-acetylglucosamine synthase-like glycosyltransferase